MTMRRETCTCGAASPAPSWSSMVSNMSSIRRWISGAPIASGETGSATCRRMGWPRRATLRTAMAPRFADRGGSCKHGLRPRRGAGLVGLGLGAGGVALHGWARRTLGPMWSGVVQVRAQHVLVERGPYRLVRHPIYLAGLLLAAGSFLAHPSPASACLGGGFAVGVVLKAWLEERALRGVLGEEYARYAARVPALIPWPRR